MATKRIKKSDIYGGSTYPDEKKYYQFMDQERKDSKKQEKMKIGEGDTVKFTKPRKNEYDEWNSKMYVNGKVYRPAEIFASDKEDAQIQIDNAKAIYKKHGATILEDVETSKNVLREDIMQLSGANVIEEAMTEYDNKDIVDLIDFVKFVNYHKNMIIRTESSNLKKDFEMYLADALTAIKNIKELARKSGDRV